ncbi:complement regulator-acquiring protein (plasmid) [Borreliella spielmanii]|uniref:Borrelia burgdorferi virulent strain associated lipoprotein n=1 Tax=Borreliella spielmanii A14S TaxID=498742 RepID=C0RBT9_9SPIR|nr:complement regulator-acquiring protein [Borreliella spielmanii]ACN53194.1 borrelia burgdorferi virulent strain associated lipoprotein [Borreliella spielmanii A14S]
MKKKMMLLISIILFISCQADLLKKNKISKNYNDKQQPREEYVQGEKDRLLFLINSLIEFNNKAIDNSFEKFKNEPSNQYNFPFKNISWAVLKKTLADDAEQSKMARRCLYAVLDYNESELQELGLILNSNVSNIKNVANKIMQIAGIEFQFRFEAIMKLLLAKKDNLMLLDIPDLKRIRICLEDFLALRATFRGCVKQLLNDYSINKEFIKFKNSKLGDYLNKTFSNIILRMSKDPINLEQEIRNIIVI